jgi:hypothetical protein
MNINTYQQHASETAIYQNKLIYPTLGLAGEAGEIANKVKKILRDNSGELQERRSTEFDWRTWRCSLVCCGSSYRLKNRTIRSC